MATKKKADNTDIVTARVPIGVKKKLEAMAKKQDRGVSYIVKNLIIKAVS